MRFFIEKDERGIEELRIGRVIGTAIISLLGIIAILGSFEIVDPGHRGVMVTAGKPGDETLSEGVHLKVPFISSIKEISVRIQKSESGTDAATKDLQRVHSTVALNWHIEPSQVPTLYKNIGTEYDIENRVIAPAVSETLKAATAKLTAEECLTKRMELKSTVDEMLIKRLTQYGVVVKDISIVNLDFTPDFNRAIEAKQVAEQQAKQAEYLAQKRTAEAKAAVEEAKGQAESSLTNARAQAESQKLLQKTITKEVLQLEYLKRWNGVLPTVMSGNSNGLILNLPTSTKGNKNE